MNRLLTAASTLLLALLAACSSGAVKLDRNTLPEPLNGQRRTIESEACGFQLLLLLPLGINSQHRRAVEELYRRAEGDYVSNIRLVDHWGYGFVGTNYCVQLTATAIHPDASAPPLLPEPAGAPGSAVDAGPAPAADSSTTVPAMPAAVDAPAGGASRMRSDARVLAGPRPSETAIGTVAAGSTVALERTLENGTGIWCLISTGSIEGWVPIDSVTP